MTPKGMIGVIFQIYSPDDDIEDTEGEPASAPVDGNMVEVRRGKVSATDLKGRFKGRATSRAAYWTSHVWWPDRGCDDCMQGDILEYYQFYNDLIKNKISHLISVQPEEALIPGAK